MRRRPPTSDPAVSLPTVSDEERELFRAEVGEVRRLEYDKIPPTPPKRPRVPVATRARQVAQTLPALFSERFESFDVRGGEELAFARNGVQERVMRRLRRGHYPYEAILDLHGNTVAEARVELLEFLRECAQRGIHAALIIHGKGYSSADRQPILKGMVATWLRDYPDTLAYCSALPEHGGTGALYLLLRRGGAPDKKSHRRR